MIQTVQEIKATKSWEEYCSDGMNARESKDNSQWLLGDLATGISKDYGADSIGKYAYAIFVDRKTLMNYRTIAQTFSKQLRERYKKLSYSHFSCLTNVETPEAWLEQADNNEWSVEHLRSEVKKAYLGLKEPEIEEVPPVIKCPKCGLWRLKGMSTYDICKGHYDLDKGGLKYG